MEKATMISFDLDGTLVDYSFANAVWLDGIPRLYAEKEKVKLAVAKMKVRREYEAVGMESLEWYDMKYWLTKFQLGLENWKRLFKQYKHLINTYFEVPKVLQTLKNAGYKLLVTSNAAREFLDIELEKTSLATYFENAFSTTSDFNQVKKTAGPYKKILNTLDASPSEVIHIGDNWHFDFVAPREAGIESFFLDRENQNTGPYVVKNLTEFLAALNS